MAYYPFNGNANDGSGNGLNGTVHGAVLTTDRFSNASNPYNFNGTKSDIEVADNTLLDITSQISPAAWIYPVAQKTQEIVWKGQAITPSVPYGLLLSGTGDVIFELSLNGQFTQTRTAGHALNQWSFVMGTMMGQLCDYT